MENKVETKFYVGAKVKAFGVNGAVTEVRDWCTYSIVVVFDGGSHERFTADGRHYDWHKTPSLKLRKFKKKPVPSEIFVNIYEHINGFNVGSVHQTRIKADVSVKQIPRVGLKAWRYVLAKKQD